MNNFKLKINLKSVVLNKEKQKGESKRLLG